MKNIVILGSTGSIGKSTLDVVSKFPDKFKIVGLTAGKNISLLIKQIEQFSPKVVAVSDEEAYQNLKSQISNLKSANPEILFGTEGISSVAAMPDADIVISAIVGSVGLLPTIAAIKTGKVIGLANKETLVMAGNIVTALVKKHGAILLPVDSEHSAIFQCIKGHEKSSIKKIILTASGGPFIGKKTEELKDISPENALKHPNWNMGRKITIDSATLMNKGLEVIEAHYLFDLPVEKIDVLIHPQSIVHSIVEFIDGTYIAQLSRPDMKGPIAYALSYPERLHDVVEAIDWQRLSGLTFQRPDYTTFSCLSLAYSALKAGGTMPAVLNASNEIAVTAFLDGIISFNSIPVIIEKVMEFHKIHSADNINIILEADKWARKKTKEIIAYSS
ncbi:1-deoxy-D-xylulose 5-phosphate reductoisomerase [Dissulfurispira thermophila]|uniref:1-deoxy-D-xylulose 5-phosphate reductoisomerase n=2 Tax=root TaxID=1 RepID=A0A7G1GYR5_9BACT|nr:1-deoxy-D-xylulose-5-phosphate reductoisomerase [Dissulfurispira thermophila]BCB95358.1 1-deoxy-D-xylulose 5-phosphate reductoisomerase [Dissulfurispira thermophila]